MKPILLFCLPVFSLFPAPQSHPVHPNLPACDSLPINHLLDGSANEWPVERFETDKETNISYAFDHDASDLFVAMRIPDFSEQMKIMRMGMKLFIDVKGKKKENMGIEFPVRKEFPNSTPSAQPGSGENGEMPALNRKAARESMMINLISMKSFGFKDQEDREQGLLMKGEPNIAFAWDSSDRMDIEYRIPLSFLDKMDELRDKTVSIGWKINGPESNTSTTGNFGGNMPTGGRRSSPGRPINRNTGSNQDQSRNNYEKMMKEQEIWSKYAFGFR